MKEFQQIVEGSKSRYGVVVTQHDCNLQDAEKNALDCIIRVIIDSFKGLLRPKTIIEGDLSYRTHYAEYIAEYKDIETCDKVIQNIKQIIDSNPYLYSRLEAKFEVNNEHSADLLGEIFYSPLYLSRYLSVCLDGRGCIYVQINEIK